VSKYSVAFLKLIGIPVMREGNVINLVSTTLEVADACSGIRSIVSLLALATALAYFSHKGWKKRALLIFSALPIAIFANGVRVIGTGILANWYGAAAAQGFFHEFAGLVIFGVAMALLLLTSYILGKIGDRGHE
jgi:exosortase